MRNRSDVQNTINNAASGLDFSQYNQIGEYLTQGLANGAIKGQDDLNRALDAAARGAMDEFKQICGIASPSKVFAGYGEFLMMGLANGIKVEQKSVLSSLDSTAAEMERHMSGIGFDVPIAMDNSRLKAAVEKAQESLLRAQNISLSNEDFGGYTAHTSSLPKLPDMGSREMWKSSSTSDSPGEMEATITIYNQIDMDGDTVAEKVNDINARLLYRSNGR